MAAGEPGIHPNKKWRIIKDNILDRYKLQRRCLLGFYKTIKEDNSIEDLERRAKDLNCKKYIVIKEFN